MDMALQLGLLAERRVLELVGLEVLAPLGVSLLPVPANAWGMQMQILMQPSEAYELDHGQPVNTSTCTSHEQAVQTL